MHYVTKKAYDDILVSPRVKADDAKAHGNRQVAALPGQEDTGVKSSSDVAIGRKVLEVKLVNDRRSAANGILRVQAMTIDGDVVWEKTEKVSLPKNCAVDAGTVRVADMLGGENPANVFFYITFKTGGKTYYNIAYPLRQKYMAYRKPKIETGIVASADGYDVTLRSDIFARAVFMKIKGIDNFFSDNYFDLLPGQKRTVHVTTSKDLATFSHELEITTLGDGYED